MSEYSVGDLILWNNDQLYVKGFVGTDGLIVCIKGLGNHTISKKSTKLLVSARSLEIIECLEGLNGAKGTLKELKKLGWDSFEHRWIDNWECTREELELAIQQYESTYGDDDEEIH